MSTALEDLERNLQGALGASVIGMQSVIHALAIAIVARGHVLIQGAPGLGKTLLSKTLAAALGGSFKRIQGTADLMPSDIIGVHVYDTSRNEFVFRPGPLFADVLLFDEINRAGPKTQSALLEAMEERQASVDRRNYRLPAGFRCCLGTSWLRRSVKAAPCYRACHPGLWRTPSTTASSSPLQPARLPSRPCAP